MEILQHFPASVRSQVKARLRLADYAALQFSVEFEQAVKALYPNRRLFLDISAENKLRLLQLKAMVLRFRIPLSEVLEILFARYGKGRKTGLPAPILTLTGQAAWTHVRETVSTRYPQGENQTAWKVQQQAATQLLENPGSFHSISAFQLHLKRQRTKRATIKSRSLRRRYRNNPWT